MYFSSPIEGKLEELTYFSSYFFKFIFPMLIVMKALFLKVSCTLSWHSVNTLLGTFSACFMSLFPDL